MKLASLLSICRLEKSRGQSREGVIRIFKDFGQLLVSKKAHLKLVDKGCVLFFVIHPNHVRFLKPLVKELDSSRIAYRVVAYSPQVGDKLTKNEIEFEPFWLFFGGLTALRVCCVQLCWVLKALISTKGKSQVFSIIAKQGQKVLLLDAFASLLPKMHVNTLVTFKAEGFQARALHWRCAKLRGVRTFAVQHGLINVGTHFSDLWVDEYLVWSPYFLDVLNESGAACSAKVCGNPVFDDLFSSKVDKPESNTPVIYALPNSGNSHTSLSQVQLLVEAVVHLARLQPKFSIILKPHPGDVNEYVSTTAVQLNPPSNLRLIDRNGHLELKEADVAVINNSAVGMEAAVLGVPLVIMADQVQNIMVPQYLREGIASFASSSKELSQRIEEIFENKTKYQENCAHFVHEYLSNHGMAAKSIVNELLC